MINQLANGGWPIFHRKLYSFRITEPSTGVQCIFDVGGEGITFFQNSRNTTLGIIRTAFGQRPFAEHGGPHIRGQLQGEGQPCRPGTND